MIYFNLNRTSTEQRATNQDYLWQKNQWWPSLVALFTTLFLHIIVISLFPENLFMQRNVPENQQEEMLEVIIESPEVPRYVEANPQAPENEPDKTDNYSFRSQQAADENSEDSSSDVPDAGGETDTRKIVQGAF